MRRILVTVVTTGFLLGVTAPAASAHSVSGVSATNFRTELRSVAPEVPGLTMRVIEAGSRFELENRSDEEVLVFGYSKEPYLRVGPEGVFENTRSPATYLNRSRRGILAPPGNADPTAPPEWRKVSSEPVARWHDHRIHWMGNQDPPAVRRDPGRRHVVIPDWVVEMRRGETTIAARGELVWVPGPSPFPWLLLALLLAVGVVALALRPAWGPALAAAAAALVAVDAFHAIGVGFANAGSFGTRLGKTLGGSYYSFPAWFVAGLGVYWLTRRRSEGAAAVAVSAAVMGLAGGFADLTNLTRSQVPFAWATSLVRLAVALTIGLGTGVFAGALLNFRRSAITEVAAGGAKSP
jgi:hypothetical protein